MNALSIVSENERVTKDWEIFSQNLNPPQKLVLSWDFLALTGTYKSNSDRETLSAVCEYESVEDFIAKFTSGKRPHLNDFEWSFLNSEGTRYLVYANFTISFCDIVFVFVSHIESSAKFIYRKGL